MRTIKSCGEGWGVGGIQAVILNLSTTWGQWSKSYPCCFTSTEITPGRLRLKCDGARAETRFRLSAKRTSPFRSAGASVQSTAGSRGVRISGSNAGYTMFQGTAKSTGYPLHSPVSPSLSPPMRHRVPSHFNWTLPTEQEVRWDSEPVWELGIRHKSAALCQKLSHDTESILLGCDTLSVGN